MKTILVSRIGSLHSRNRVSKRRYGIGKITMCYAAHIGKKSIYFYPAWCSRPIRQNDVFKD